MIIALYSLKGGVGKTSISLNLSIEMNHKLIDNDPFGGVTELLNYGKQKKMGYSIHEDEEYIPKFQNTVYDFGGFKDNRAGPILKESDVVIVPTLHSYSDIKTTVSAIIKLNDLGQNKVIIAIGKINTSNKKQIGSQKIYKDYFDTKTQIQKLCDQKKIDISHIKFVGIRDNKSWTKSTSTGKSINQLAATSRLIEHSSKGGTEDLNSLINTVLDYQV